MQTSRLLLRRYVAGDQHDFVMLNLDPVARQHMDGPLSKATAERLFETLLESETCWAITNSADRTYVGHIFLSHDTDFDALQLGFIIRPTDWGQGYASEAGRVIVAQVASRPLVATVDADNKPSHRVLEKLGFRFDSWEHDAEGKFAVYWLRD